MTGRKKRKVWMNYARISVRVSRWKTMVLFRGFWACQSVVVTALCPSNKCTTLMKISIDSVSKIASLCLLQQQFLQCQLQTQQRWLPNTWTERSAGNEGFGLQRHFCLSNLHGNNSLATVSKLSVFWRIRKKCTGRQPRECYATWRKHDS